MLKFFNRNGLRPPRIRLGIVGCGVMGARHARMFRGLASCALVAVADILPKKAAAVAGRYGIAATFSSIDEMLEGGNVDAVSIVTTDATHVSLALKAILRGKHVLCEKPLAANAADAYRLAAAAKEGGVMNMVNLSYRGAPAIQAARALIQSGEIGPVIHVEASYLQDWLGRPAWREDSSNHWRLSTGHGSRGVLSDLGIHVLDFASYPVGDITAVSCRLRSFEALKGPAIGDFKWDANDSAVIQLEFENGALGVIHTTRWAAGHKNSLRLRVYGERGSLSIDLDSTKNHLWLCRGRHLKSARWKKIRCPSTPNNYARFIASIRDGVNGQPDFSRGARIQQILDACERSSESGVTALVGPAPPAQLVA